VADRKPDHLWAGVGVIDSDWRRAASVPGSFAFTTPNAVPAAGTTAQSVTFTPTDTTANISGTYFIIVCANYNNAAVETNTANNCTASGSIQVQ
jgi:hypothetical protein